MAELWVLLVFGLLVAILAVPVWLITTLLSLRRQQKLDRETTNRHLADLTARLYALENRLNEPAKGTPKEPAQPVATPEIKIPVPVEVPPEPPAVPLSPPPPPPSAPLPIPEVQPEEVEPPPPLPVIPPRIATREVSPARASHDLEERLGTNWLNKIGITILVLGLAFFLAYELKNLGPAGKVALGLTLSAGMILAGVRYESSDRYRILARAGAAGGWSLLFFISYAVYHVPAAHLINSRELDLLLMLAVAGTIVWYSLRYCSETTTALAFFLAFLTTTVHRGSIYSLFAGVVLALAIVAISLRESWFALEIFGIVGVYFGHFMWLHPVVEGRGAGRGEFPEFRLSTGLLALYWLLFRISYVVRRPADRRAEDISGIAALANAFLLIALLRYQSAHPEWAFWTLLALGGLELVSAAAARRRRQAFVLLATLGSALILLAFPFRYSGSDLSLLWLIGAEVFFLSGLLTRETVYRRMGLAAMLLVTGQLLLDNLDNFQILGEGTNHAPFVTPAILFGVGALLFYFNSLRAPKHWADVTWTDFDHLALESIGYLGGLLALLSAWLAWPGMWTGVAWSALALLLYLASRYLYQRPLAIQGNVVAICAVISVCVSNFVATENWHGMSLRLVTVAATATLLYAGSFFASNAVGDAYEGGGVLTALHTCSASGLLAILAYKELPYLWVAVVWALGGVVLFEIGRVRNSVLRWQAYLAVTASFARILVVNLEAGGGNTTFSPRLYTSLPAVLAYFYLDSRLRGFETRSNMPELDWIRPVFSYFGSTTVAALLFFQLQANWIAAGWAALGLALVALAWMLNRSDFLTQSLVLSIVTMIRATTSNLAQMSGAGAAFWQTQKFFAGVATLLLFAALPFAFVIRRAIGNSENIWPWEKRPEQVFFFTGFILLTILIASESSRGGLTVNWGIEGVLVFLFALMVEERSFRLAGLGLLLLCVLKILLMDVWGLDPQSRYITLIVLGGALLFVSFLYTRHKEKFQRYL